MASDEVSFHRAGNGGGCEAAPSSSRGSKPELEREAMLASYSIAAMEMPVTASTGAASRLLATWLDNIPSYFSSNQFYHPDVFKKISGSIDKGIDCAVANNEVPLRARELSALLKEVLVYGQHLPLTQAEFTTAIAASTRCACRLEWFSQQDTLILMNEATKIWGRYNFSGPPQQDLLAALWISDVLFRFAPWLEMDSVLTSFTAQPGYHSYAVDFPISRDMVSSQENLWLLVFRLEDMENPDCLITPPGANFLLNGLIVQGRHVRAMHFGPQRPSNVTRLLKYGVNHIQLAGEFQAGYLVAIVVSGIFPWATDDVPKLEDNIQNGPPSTQPDPAMSSSSRMVSLDNTYPLLSECQRIRREAKLYRKETKKQKKGGGHGDTLVMGKGGGLGRLPNTSDTAKNKPPPPPPPPPRNVQSDNNDPTSKRRRFDDQWDDGDDDDDFSSLEELVHQFMASSKP